MEIFPSRRTKADLKKWADSNKDKYKALQQWTDRLGGSSVEEDMDSTILNVLITSDCINDPKGWSFFTEENQIIVLKPDKYRSNKLRALRITYSTPPEPYFLKFKYIISNGHFILWLLYVPQMQCFHRVASQNTAFY